MQKGKFNIIIGGQAGSESKGKLSAWLVDKHQPDLIVMTSSPNAGHTAILPDGTKKVSYHLPIGSIFSHCLIILGPASLINPLTFRDEIISLGIDPSRIIIDHRASIITTYHIRKETGGKLSDLGSTLQGVGACRSSKMNRINGHVFVGDNDHVKDYFLPGISIADTNRIIQNYLICGKTVLCESTQGFDLDLEHGLDPHYCTSKMVNTSMIMAEAGVPPQKVGNVYGVVRPFPIRVNNRTGSSGSYGEAKEITWQDVADQCGYPHNPEYFGEITTTTKLPRRVFEFAWEQYAKFVRVCGPTHICLQFANYIDWNNFEKMDITDPVMSFVRKLEMIGGVPVTYVGTGPAHKHMMELVDSNRQKTLGHGPNGEVLMDNGSFF